MANQSRLTKLLTDEKFGKIESVFHKHFQLGLEMTDVRGREVDEMCSADCHPEFCQIVRGSTTGLKRCNKDRRRSLGIAIETGQSYITLCHAGIVLVCVPVMDKDKALGGMFFGKCLWGPVTEMLVEDVHKRLKGIRIDRDKLVESMDKLAVIAGQQIQRAAEFLFDLLYEMAGFDPRVIRCRRQSVSCWAR